MSKMIVALVTALVLAGAGCSSSSTATTATGCVASRPAMGTIDASPGTECLVQWSCSSGAQVYTLDCALQPDGNYRCYCSSNTSAAAQGIVINPFSCDLQGGALPAAAQCGWMLQM